MARVGWFKLWRKINENGLWKKKPFSPGQAWIDLLIRCNFSDKSVPDPGRVGLAKLAPGEAIVSLRCLMGEWGWSQNKVVRFLKSLENERMIERTNERTFTRLKVLNWRKYQGDDEEDERAYVPDVKAGADAPPNAPTDAGTNARADNIRRSKEGEEDKEGKEEKNTKAQPGRQSEVSSHLTEVDRQLIDIAEKVTHLEGASETVARYVRAWRVRTDGAFVHQFLMDPANLGKRVVRASEELDELWEKKNGRSGTQQHFGKAKTSGKGRQQSSSAVKESLDNRSSESEVARWFSKNKPGGIPHADD